MTPSALRAALRPLVLLPLLLAGPAVAQTPPSSGNDATPGTAPGPASIPAPAPAPAAGVGTAPSGAPGTAPSGATSGAPSGATSGAPPGGAASAGDTAVTIDALGWLAGCWRGSVNQRLFREQWLPLAGAMLVGSGQTVNQGQAQDYEYLRIESRSDGVWYVTQGTDHQESAFRFVSVTRDEVNAATIYTFERTGAEFPQRVVYRRGTEGWLYASVEGMRNGQERKVIYPMRRVSCETDDFIRQ